MEPLKDLNKSLNENQPKNKNLVLDSDDDSDFDLDLLSNLEDLEKRTFFSCLQDPFQFIIEGGVQLFLEHDIKCITDILSVSKAEASRLLLHCDWKVNAVSEIWFTNGEKVQEELGLSGFSIIGESSNARDMTCGICSGAFSQEQTSSAPCGHIFCKTCWEGYIGKSITDGRECLMLRCPDPICSAAVGQDMILMLASDDDKDTYARYFLRSYIECNPKAKWCTASGCKFAVFLLSDTSSFKVICKCSNSFCWKCTKESHEPISCAAVRKWEMESLVQSKNWTIANNKHCPNCGQLIDVKGRCKLLECASCKFQFCKLCLVSWLAQSLGEGDHYSHVCLEHIRNQPHILEEEARVKVAQQKVNRYHSRQLQWKSHDMHVQVDLEELQKLQSGQLEVIANKQGLTVADMSFVKEAWLQIVDGKRFFKWACVYDYYLVNYKSKKRILFNYLLRRAEIILELLYQFASKVTTFLNIDGPKHEFMAYRAELFNKTRVNKNYFCNMAWAIENKFPSMEALRPALRSRMLANANAAAAAAAAAASNAAAAASTSRNNGGGPVDLGQPWDCAHCQFRNDALSSACVMCYHY